MGVTDVNSITVNGVKNFMARLVSEERARRNWHSKWGWMLEQYKDVNSKLKKLKGERTEDVKKEKIKDDRTTLPLPESVNHEYGWLASKPDFNPNKYRCPGLVKLPTSIPQEMIWAILDKANEKVKI